MSFGIKFDVKHKRPKKARWREKVARDTKAFAELVRDEMRAIVVNHGTTTNREQKIVVTQIDEFHYSVGANDTGLYYLNNGNGGRNASITPSRKKAMLFVYKGELMLRSKVRGYDGIHFVEEVARRHRK